MPLTDEVRNHLNFALNAADERLGAEREATRKEAASEIAARGLGNSGPGVAKIITVYQDWLKKRIETYVDVYLDTLATLHIPIDLGVAAEIVERLTVIATKQYTPPNVSNLGPLNFQAKIKDHFTELMNHEGARALVQAKARVQLARLKTSHPAPVEPPTPTIHFNTATGFNARVNTGGATDNSVNTVNYTVPEVLNQLLALSSAHGDAATQAAAADVKRAFPEKKSMADRLAKWVTLASSSGHLMHESLPYLHKLYEYLNL